MEVKKIPTKDYLTASKIGRYAINAMLMASIIVRISTMRK